MAETNALLKRHTGNCIEGSNPSVSASQSTYCKDLLFYSLRVPGKRHFLPGFRTSGEPFSTPNTLQNRAFLCGRFSRYRIGADQQIGGGSESGELFVPAGRNRVRRRQSLKRKMSRCGAFDHALEHIRRKEGEPNNSGHVGVRDAFASGNVRIGVETGTCQGPTY